MPVCNHSIVSVVNRAEAETLYTFLSKINPDVTSVLHFSEFSSASLRLNKSKTTNMNRTKNTEDCRRTSLPRSLLVPETAWQDRWGRQFTYGGVLCQHWMAKLNGINLHFGESRMNCTGDETWMGVAYLSKTFTGTKHVQGGLVWVSRGVTKSKWDNWYEHWIVVIISTVKVRNN